LKIVIRVSLVALLIFWGLRQQRQPENLYKLEDAPKGNYQRIVSLAPGLTELISDLGGESRLVGVTESCDYPESIKSLPKVANYQRLHLEQIVTIKPDLVVALDGSFNKAEDLKRIAEHDIPVVLIPQVSLNETANHIREVGEFLNLPLGEKKAEEFKRSLENIGKLSSPQKIFVQLERKPIYSAGAGTIFDDIIIKIGGENVTAKITSKVSYPRLSVESILKARPDIILLSSLEWKEDWKRFPQLSKTKFCTFEPSTLARTGMRLFIGIETILNCEVTG